MQLYKGLEYIKIDIANQYGLDKISFEERIHWVNGYSLKELKAKIDDAKDTYRYAAALYAYEDAMNGTASGHLVGLDACSSGPQIMSVLMRCKTGCENTGIGNKRKDLYQVTTDTMNTLLHTGISTPRKDVKSALMPHYYGSKKQPKIVFGEDTVELDAFYKAQKLVAPGAAKLMDIMLDCWQEDADFHAWIMPDGFNVIKPVLQTKDTKIEVDELDHKTFTYRHKVIKGKEKGLSIAADIIHSIDGFINRELCRRCNYDPKRLIEVLIQLKKLRERATDTGVSKNSSFISLEAIEQDMSQFSKQYIEELIYLVEDVMAQPTFEVVSIHDEFMCHANYMNYLRKVYIELLAEISESTIIDDILSSIIGEEVYLLKMDHKNEKFGDMIRSSNYPLS